MDPEEGLGHAPRRLRGGLDEGGPGPGEAVGPGPPSGGRASGASAEKHQPHRTGAGHCPLQFFGEDRPARAPGGAGGGAAPPGPARPGGGVPAAVVHPVRRPGAVRRPAGGRPHGAGRVRRPVPAGPLPVRRGDHPRLPGPGDGGGDHPPDGPPGAGALSPGGGRPVHPHGDPGPGAAVRRRPLSAGLLRPGAEPVRGGAAVPGDDHGLPHLRPAHKAARRQLVRPEPLGGGAPSQLSGGAAQAAVLRFEGPAGGGPPGGLPPGGPAARPGAGGAEPGGPRRPGQAAAVRPGGGAAGPGGPLGAGTPVPHGGGPALWPAGAHVRFPDG